MPDTDISIREATAEDIPQLQALIAEVFEEYDMEFIAEDEIPDLLNFESYYKGQSPILLVAIDQDQPVGCAALKLDDDHGIYFSRVYVDQTYRGQRIGFRLMHELLKRAASIEHQSVYLWTDTRFDRAHRFYQRLGFSYTGHIRPLHDINDSFEYHYRLNRPLQELLNELKDA
jgi:N-acetylglutamate synthase-like GNAT family acetyltransferase